MFFIVAKMAGQMRELICRQRIRAVNLKEWLEGKQKARMADLEKKSLPEKTKVPVSQDRMMYRPQTRRKVQVLREIPEQKIIMKLYLQKGMGTKGIIQRISLPCMRMVR